MTINIIAAVARNNALGFNNQLLYHIRDDMRRFKRLTTGNTIIMGRRTFESLPKGALPNRRNIVLSRSVKCFDGCDTYTSLSEALAHCNDADNVFIIGGASVYKEALAFADHLYMTEIDDTPKEADVFFPDYSRGWKVVAKDFHPNDDTNKYAYAFVDYERDINIEDARKEDAAAIAPMIMEAMDYDCCRWFAGEHHTLDDFKQLMIRLVRMDCSQYSYRNTLVARTADGSIAGICVAYDGAELHRLRQAFIDGAKEAFGIDYSDIDDETHPGEWYLDSLCVDSRFRHRGIASRLLHAEVEKAHAMGLPAALLVDDDNPKAEALYQRVGFHRDYNTTWGGHKMHHMISDERKG